MNVSECSHIINQVLDSELLNLGYARNGNFNWTKITGMNCFESFAVNHGKFGFNISFGFGSEFIPFCKGYDDLKMQKIGKLTPNFNIDFSKPDVRNDSHLIKWLSNDVILEIQVKDVLDNLMLNSSIYIGKNKNITEMIKFFNLEKDKYHFGLPFYCIINNVILEFIFSNGLNLEMKNRLDRIYKGEKWLMKAMKAIEYIKIAQQADASDLVTNAIFAPVPARKK